jgi:hypothetical protein
VTIGHEQKIDFCASRIMISIMISEMSKNKFPGRFVDKRLSLPGNTEYLNTHGNRRVAVASLKFNMTILFMCWLTSFLYITTLRSDLSIATSVWYDRNNVD